MRSVLTIICALWSQVVSADVCDGRYAAPAALIDAAYSKYGTLYSGGMNYESLGPTLSLYRLMMGLPDAGLMEPADRGLAFLDPPPTSVSAVLARSLARMRDPDFRKVTPEGQTDSEVLLNVYTTIGPFPGWWLTPDAPHLTETERVIALFAHDDVLDWLLTIQAASARPHTISWGLQSGFRDGRSAAMRGLLVHALQRYQDKTSLPWLLAVMHMREDRRHMAYLSPELRTVFSQAEAHVSALGTQVGACDATDAEYAAFAIARYEQERFAIASWRAEPHAVDTLHYLPAILRQQAAVELAKIEISGLYYGWNPMWSHLSADDLRRLADDPRFDSWLNAGASYRAGSVGALVDINADVPLHRDTIRLLNVLSADDLLHFARQRDAYPDEQRGLTTAAFLRLVALGRDDDAAEIVPEIMSLWPRRQELLEAAWARDGTLGYRLVMVALSLPAPRVVIALADDIPLQTNGDSFWTSARVSRDLPLSIRTGAFLTADFRNWMGSVGTISWMGYRVKQRAYRRGMTLPDPLTGKFTPLPETLGLYHRDHLGLAGFAAWDELAQLGPQSGLANRIGREIIANARAQTSSWRRFFADQEALAQELEMVIWQGRRMIHGDMEGRPLGQVAFALLHDRLGQTGTAQRVRYWYICRERCEP
ncbi:hypothetical protein [Yoonia sp. BS5-3]|uniref:Uncharacterized protein n=1 Tax=Yoonia phaeophyticola TaxID=3137369 RepID=A0ABZ2V890_9RHOB